MTQSEAGKGDDRRPESERGDYRGNHERIYGKRCIKHPQEKAPCKICSPGWRMEKDVCTICGRKMVDGICPEQLRQQRERT